MKAKFLIVVITTIIVISASVSVIWMEYGAVCNKPVTDHLKKYSNLFDGDFDGKFSMESIGLPFGVTEHSIQECVNQTLEKRLKDKIIEKQMVSSKFTGMEKIGKLLALNQVNYNPDTLVVTGGPGFSGDPGCGAVIDTNLQTRWFTIDSVSNPKKMTMYSENPHPCKVNTTSCFCNAQMELTFLMLDNLSYFSNEEEEQYAAILLKYIQNNAGMKNIEPKFTLGKLNLNFTDPDAVGYCGERPGDNRNDFFSGAIVNGHVRDYGLDRELPLLCAIPKDAKWWESKNFFHGKTQSYWKNLDEDSLVQYYEKVRNYEENFFVELGVFLIRHHLEEKLRELEINPADKTDIDWSGLRPSLPPRMGFEIKVNSTDGKDHLVTGTIRGNEILDNFQITEYNERQIGWTPAFEYSRVQINGTTALQICSVIEITCIKNPVWDAIYRHDKDFTYFYFDTYDADNKVQTGEHYIQIDKNQICHSFEDISSQQIPELECQKIR